MSLRDIANLHNAALLASHGIGLNLDAQFNRELSRVVKPTAPEKQDVDGAPLAGSGVVAYSPCEMTGDGS